MDPTPASEPTTAPAIHACDGDAPRLSGLGIDVSEADVRVGSPLRPVLSGLVTVTNDGKAAVVSASVVEVNVGLDISRKSVGLLSFLLQNIAIQLSLAEG